MNSKTGYLFPAFAMKYKDFSRPRGNGHDEEVQRSLERARRIVDLDMRKFDQPDKFLLDDPLQDALQEHYVCYIDNCAIGNLLERMKIPCDYVAGYSMGIFSALQHSGAVSFEDGLHIMRNICTFAHETVGEGTYGMGVIGGLKLDDVVGLINSHSPQVEITDICGPHLTIISGGRSEVEVVLDASIKAGSLQAKLLPVSLPFHSSLLKQVEGQTREMLDQIELRAPRFGIVSCLDQTVLLTAEAAREEIVRNVTHPINWYRTMHRLLDLGVNVFLECGLSDSLCKLAGRGLKGKYTTYHFRQFDRLFNSAA